MAAQNETARAQAGTAAVQAERAAAWAGRSVGEIRAEVAVAQAETVAATRAAATWAVELAAAVARCRDMHPVGLEAEVLLERERQLIGLLLGGRHGVP